MRRGGVAATVVVLVSVVMPRMVMVVVEAMEWW